ncbi:hypothetical protein [Ancylobacter pratisalsi]|uniref:bestrophin-like domain n=1 Tax=Ancylobacter pratisalsi TaxID=1745854 RepID=UPI001AEE992C|nr:hypothetical protein [Ancylobacter pratisalsi]
MTWTQLVVDEFWLFVSLVFLGPLLTGGIAYYVAMRPSMIAWLDPKLFSPTYLGALTLPFSLFLAFMIGDIWNRETHYAQTVLEEAQSIDAMLDLTGVCGQPCQGVDDALRTYARNLSANEWNQGWVEPAPVVVAAMDSVVVAIAQAEAQGAAAPHIRSALMAGKAELRRLRTDRYFILHADLAPHRGFVVVLLGILSQIGLAALHIGRRQQLIVSLLTFSLAFSVTLAYTATLAWPTVDESIIPAEELQRILSLPEAPLRDTEPVRDLGPAVQKPTAMP